MKTKILEGVSLQEGYNFGENYNIKNSKSFIIIKNNLVEYLEKYDELISNDSPLIKNPLANFKIIKLTKDTNKGYMHSSYKIKIDYGGLNNVWYFIDLNSWKKFWLDFNANYTILNKSNEYSGV